MKLILLFFIVLNTILAKAQKEGNQWYIERGNAIDFNEDTIRFLNGCVLGNNESSSSICDSNGQMLFYSNGITLYNRFHQSVKNGTDLGFPIRINETTSSQGTLIVKHPNNDSLMYLFSTDYQGKSGGLVYSVIDIHGNNDSGEVISKKNKLTGSINEPIIAFNHHNGRDVWICVHGRGNSRFHLFLLKKDGLIDCTIEQNAGFNHSNDAQKSMKVSVSGDYIAHNDHSLGYFEIIEFTKNGTLNTHYFQYDYVAYYEFSPNSKYLFINYYDSIVKLDLETKKRIKLQGWGVGVFPVQLQLASDGKIYAPIYNSKDLFIIDNPSLNDLFINYTIKNNFFNNTIVTSLPTFNQSYFYNPAINYSYEMNCVKNSIQFWGKDTFGANSHTWHIKKLAVSNWQLIGSTKNINYTFADTGTYEVRYIASNGNKADTVVKSIVLYDKIKQGFLGKDTVFAQGDLINKTLKAPVPNHCVQWQDSSSLSTFTITKKGTYICKVTNQAFCEVWDTIVISECINNLNQPSLFRSRDTLRTFHLNADSFVWYRNNQIYKITKQAFLALTDTGTYRVEAAKKGHCNSGSIGQLLVNRLSVNGIIIEELGIRVFPNPSNGVVRIESNNRFKFEVYDISGRIIEKGENNKELSLPKGIYFLRFDVNGYKVTEKVVVF